MALTSSASDVTLVHVCIGTDVDEAMLICAEVAWVQRRKQIRVETPGNQWEEMKKIETEGP